MAMLRLARLALRRGERAHEEVVGPHAKDPVEALVAAANLVLAHERVAELHRVQRGHFGRRVLRVGRVAWLEE